MTGWTSERLNILKWRPWERLTGPNQSDLINVYATGLILSLLLLAYRLIIQSIISVNNGRGWDGGWYHQMAVDYDAVIVPLPWRLRIGLPFLVHYIPIADTLYKFKLVNLGFGILFSMIAYVGISKFSKSTTTRIIAWLLICATAVSPIPLTIWYPANIDTIPNLLLLMVLLLSLARRQSIYSFAILFALGTLCRENFPMFICLLLLQTKIEPTPSISTFFTKNVQINYTPILNGIGAVFGALIGLVIVYVVTGDSPVEQKTGNFVFHLVSKNLVKVVAASINVYGALFVFIAASYIITKRYRGVVENRYALLLCLLALTIVSLGGGTNTERFLYWGLIILVINSLSSMDELFLYGNAFCNFVLIAFVTTFQRFLLPIYTEGIGECGITGYLSGNSTWTGHWTQICSNFDSLALIGYYGIFIVLMGLAVFFANIAVINSLHARTLPQTSDET